MTSTLTAQFIAPAEYLSTYGGGMWSAPKYIDYLSEVHPGAAGVVIMFGSAVVDHWLQLEAFYGMEQKAQTQQEFLDQSVAERLQRVLSSRSASVPCLEFLSI